MSADIFAKEAESNGFEQGWSDGMNGKPAMPQPKITFGMFDVAYLKGFKAAYLDGHATAHGNAAPDSFAAIEKPAKEPCVGARWCLSGKGANRGGPMGRRMEC